MSKQLLSVVILCSLLGMLAAEDTIPGGNVSGNWYAANSPYYIAGNITVASNDTLIIEPGVSVNFLGLYHFTVNGYLEATGTASDSIHFSSDTGTVWWTGIRVSSGTRPFAFCTFRNSIVGIDCSFTGSPVVSHCTFSDNYFALRVLYATNSDPQISNSIFRNNIGGTGGALSLDHLNGSAPVQITGCIFEHNQTATEGGAIYLDNLSQNVFITDCVFAENTAVGGSMNHGGGAILADSSSVSLSHCTFYKNHATFDGGAVLTRYSPVVLDHCTFSDNSCGTSGVGDCLYKYHDNGLISNCIFAYNPGSAILVFGGSLSEVMYCDFYGNYYSNIQVPNGIIPDSFGILDTINYNGDSCDVYFNIFMDPIFEDTASGNYHLTLVSPCIDAGDPSYPLDPDSTVSDQGAFYFHQTGVVASPVIRHAYADKFVDATIFRGPLQLPKDKKCKVFDITGRIVEPTSLRAGIYYIEIEGVVVQKVVKIR